METFLLISNISAFASLNPEKDKQIHLREKEREMKIKLKKRDRLNETLKEKKRDGKWKKRMKIKQ